MLHCKCTWFICHHIQLVQYEKEQHYIEKVDLKRLHVNETTQPCAYQFITLLKVDHLKDSCEVFECKRVTGRQWKLREKGGSNENSPPPSLVCRRHLFYVPFQSCWRLTSSDRILVLRQKWGESPVKARSGLIIPSAQHLATDSLLMIFQCDLVPVGFVQALCLFGPDIHNVGTCRNAQINHASSYMAGNNQIFHIEYSFTSNFSEQVLHCLFLVGHLELGHANLDKY